MRRFGMALCAALVLCQLLAFPVAAEPVTDDSVITDGAATIFVAVCSFI